MYDLDFVVFVGFCCVVAGFAIGTLSKNGFNKNEKQTRELETALEKSKEENQQYKEDVAKHFTETATLINGLTQKYKDVHDHLAASADALCTDENGKSLLTGLTSQLRIEERVINEEHSPLEPPLDYAPKDETNNTGTLDESYGLEKVGNEEALAENASEQITENTAEKTEKEPA